MPDEGPSANEGHIPPTPRSGGGGVTLTSIAGRDLDTPAQQKLRTELRALLRQHAQAPPTDRGGSNLTDRSTTWPKLAAHLARAGIALTDDRGGRRRMWDVLSVAAQELGRTAADMPLLTSSVMAATIARRSGHRALASQLLQGTTTATFLTPYEEPIGFTTAGQFHGGRAWASVTGVGGAADADLLLLLCGDTLVSVDREWAELTPSDSVDDTRRLFDVTVRGALGSVLAEGDRALFAVEEAAEAASAMLAMEQAALASTCIQIESVIVEGSPPSTERRCANRDKAVSAARYAVDCVAADDPHVKVAVSAARVLCSTVSFRAAQELKQSIQNDCVTAPLLIQRARGSALAFGGPLWHRRRLAQLMTSPSPIEKPLSRRIR